LLVLAVALAFAAPALALRPAQPVDSTGLEEELSQKLAPSRVGLEEPGEANLGATLSLRDIHVRSPSFVSSPTVSSNDPDWLVDLEEAFVENAWDWLGQGPLLGRPWQWSHFRSFGRDRDQLILLALDKRVRAPAEKPIGYLAASRVREVEPGKGDGIAMDNHAALPGYLGAGEDEWGSLSLTERVLMERAVEQLDLKWQMATGGPDYILLRPRDSRAIRYYLANGYEQVPVEGYYEDYFSNPDDEAIILKYAGAGQEEQERFVKLKGRIDNSIQGRAGVLVATPKGFSAEGLEELAKRLPPGLAARLVVFKATQALAQQIREINPLIRVIEGDDFSALLPVLLAMPEADRVTVLASLALAEWLREVLPPSMDVNHLDEVTLQKILAALGVPQELLDKIDPTDLETLFAPLVAA